MLHPNRLAASEISATWMPEDNWEARFEAAERRAEIAQLVSGGMLNGTHPDYLAILDADDPRILAADYSPLMPILLRALRDGFKRALTAVLRRRPIRHYGAEIQAGALHDGGVAADPFRGLQA